jgi:phage shock protein C
MNGGRVLRRSRSDRMIAGVCGGVGEYMGVKPNIVRLVVAILTVIGGSGGILYLLGWLLIPDESSDRSVAQQLVGKR